MLNNGQPISDYSLRPTAASISYSLAFEEEEARHAAGLSRAEYDALPGTPMWINPEYPTESKAHVLVWYRMHNRIPAVAQDAQAKKIEQESRARKHGR